MMIGLITFVSVEDTKPYHEELSEYQVPTYSPNTLDLTSYLERQAYERAHSKYQFRVFRTIVVVGVGLIGLYYILKPRKMIISQEELKVYTWFKRKPSIHKKWEDVSAIHLGAGTGLHGFFGSLGMQIDVPNTYGAIQSEYIGTSGYIKADEISSMVQDLTLEGLEIVDRTVDCQSIAPKVLFQTGWSNLKENYKIYYLFSGITCLLAGLQQYFRLSPANFIALWASLYFGYRALGALYYYAFCHANGKACNFDDSWAYSKGQLGRIIGATILKDLFAILFIIMGVLTIMMEVAFWQKMLVLIPLGIMAFLICTRLFLIPYIAGIIDKNQSYMATNTYMFKRNTRPIFALACLGLLYSLVLVGAIYPYMDNLEGMVLVLQKFVYVNIGFTCLMTPFYTTCAMTILKDLPSKEEEVLEGGDLIEEIL
jgi:uncharacterized membrane protein HdeD (DUF308 family)